MSETEHLKCPCRHCGGSIEFPSHGQGLAVNCPHCGEKTLLSAPPLVETSPASSPGEDLMPQPHLNEMEPAEPTAIDDLVAPAATTPLGGRDVRSSPRKGRLVWGALLLLFAAVVASALFIYQDHWTRPNTREQIQKTSEETPPTLSEINTLSGQANTLAATPVAKSTADLKVGPITLEKAKGSSLVHAVGVLRNDSNRQRFGVTIELALRDARGQPAGSAKDYRAVLEPRQQWRFRALVLDAKAVSATVSEIREEE